MKEEWRDVKGYEGFYKVSNIGRVLSLKRKTTNEHIMKQHINHDGYWEVNLCMNNKAKTCRVHRLVAEAFIPNPMNFPIINHKDENKLNNNYNNLEWCTVKHNTRYNNMHIRRMAYRKKPIVAEKDGVEILYSCSGDVAIALGVSRGNISSCALKSYGHKSIHGYHFRYATDEDVKRLRNTAQEEKNK